MLASQIHCTERIREKWPAFLAKRQERLVQQERYGTAAEKVTENIIEDLFTEVLDWEIADLNNQVGYTDILLSRLGVKYLIIETKRPGALAWNHSAVKKALDQARGYADEQKVSCVAISDGVMLYAADVRSGGLEHRVFASLQKAEAPEHLWWLSVHGIYRPCEGATGIEDLPKESAPMGVAQEPLTDELLHPKYKIPVRCFAYVGDANNPATWRLPYLHADGSVDAARLPKAIQCIVTNYRGAKVEHVPERDIPSVLNRLADAARSCGKLTEDGHGTAPAYERLAEALRQMSQTQ